MPDINGTTHGPHDSDPNPLFTKYDESGLPVQVIELKGPPRIFVYTPGGERESSEKDGVVERSEPPTG